MLIKFIKIIFLFIILPQAVFSAQLQINSQTAKPGDIATFTVFTHNAPDPVDAFGFEIVYDASVMTYISGSIIRGALISEGFSFFNANNVSFGRIRIGALETGDKKIVIGASGSILSLKFNIVGNSNSQLKLENLKDDFKSWTIQNGELIIEEDQSDTETIEQNESESESENNNETVIESETDNENETVDQSENLYVNDQSIDKTTNKTRIIFNSNNSEDKNKSFTQNKIPASNTIIAVSNDTLDGTKDNSKEFFTGKEKKLNKDAKTKNTEKYNQNTNQNESIHNTSGKNSDIKNTRLQINNDKTNYHQKNDKHNKPLKKQQPVSNQAQTNFKNDNLEQFNEGYSTPVKLSGSEISGNTSVYSKHIFTTSNFMIYLSVFSLIIQIGILGLLFLIYRRICKK